MSKPSRDATYLADIEEASERILNYTRDLDYETFLTHPMVQNAVLRNFQILGEATKKLSSALRQNYPDVPWREIAGMRDKIVHDYFGVNFDTVWDVVQQDLPQLRQRMTAILDEMAE